MSTIQPTPPSGATAQGPATTTARITSGVQALANTRPGGTVQVQVTSVSPGGQVTFSAPGGEITVQTSGSNSRQTPSQGTGQSGGQAGNQAGGQSTGQSAEQTQGRAPATLKPGDIYTLRAGPRGSDTVSLTPQRAAPPPSADPAAPPPPRAEGSVPARLVPGAITTATIIPRPGDAPVPPTGSQAQPASQGPTSTAQPQVNTASGQTLTGPPPSSGQAPAQPQATAPPGGAPPQAPPGDPGATARANAPAPSAGASTTSLASLARAGTGALLQTALNAARAITDGATRQALPPGGSTPTSASSVNTAPPPSVGIATAPTAGRAPVPANVGQYGPPAGAPRLPLGANASVASTPGNVPSPQITSQTSPAPPQSAGPPQATVTTDSNATTRPQAATATPGNHPGQAPSNASTASSNVAAGTVAAQGSATAAGAPTTAGATTPGAQPASTLIERFAQIQRVDLRILSVQHPGASTTNASTPATTPQGQVVAGTVIGLSRSGQTILGTPRGLMTMVGQGDFPPGSRVEIEILPQSARRAGGQVAGPPPAPLAHLARHWATLDEAIRLLETANPSAANQITQNHVARPGPQLTAAIALFITAVRGGDFRAWLGESNARALELARGGIGATLSEEFGTMQRASEPNDGGWRGFFIPFMDDGQLNQVRFFLHQENNGGDDKDRDGTDRTRFVVDLSLSQLGDLQIDGAVQPQTVDLLIRTRESLPEHMRREIREIFTTTLARTGIEGQLAFRTQKTFPTLPIEELHGYQDSPTSDLHI